MKIGGFSIGLSFKSLIFSIEALMKEIRAVVTEKREVEYGDESFLIALLESLDYQGFNAGN